MTQRITDVEYMRAIDHLIENGLRVPHGFFPGSIPGGVNYLNTRAKWNAYKWNPEPADPKASSKPTWSAVVAAAPTALLAIARERHAVQVRQEARRRITLAYGADDWQDEMEKRARGAGTAEQDTERDRLRGVCKALEKRIADAVTITDLESIEPVDDALWA